LLNNTGGAPVHEMSRAISAILYDKTYDLPKRSVARELLKVIEVDGMTEALAFYEQVSDDNENYMLDENEINLASYRLLESNQTRKAASVLELGLTSFPYAFNLHDSYGEMLLELGKKEEAIESYRRSVHLNPKNENGLMKLKELGIEIDPESLYLLKTDKNWTKEIFIFPLHFARDLPYLGIEESHFPEGWRDQESFEYWSYAYVWNIDLNRELTTAELESHIESYYDGLMNVVNKNKKLTLPKSVAKIERQEDGNSSVKFKGAVEVYDAFVTQNNLTLNVLVEIFYCEKKKESFLVFRVSPEEFGGQIWSELNEISLRPNICED
jgi:tetratricopeptide (TPR) repeat protein